jgi:hypothetical protein
MFSQGCYAAEKSVSKSVVLAVLKKAGITLGYASDTLQADGEVVLAAITQDWKAAQKNGHALEYASELWKTDKEVVFTAVTQSGIEIRQPAPQGR